MERTDDTTSPLASIEPGPSGLNFARIWERVAALDPSHPAVISDRRQVSFGEFDDRAERLAGHLQSAGLRRGDAVGLLLHNRVEYLEAFFAASKLGCAPFNVNYRYRSGEIAYLLDNADAAALFYERSLRAEVEAALAKATVTPALIECGADAAGVAIQGSVSFEDAVAAGQVDDAREAPDGSCVLYLYTGGTTGMPKAVIWRHEDLYDALWQLTRPGQAVPDPLESIVAGKRALTALPASPLMHGTALFIALQTLAGGGTVVLSEGTGFDPRRTIDAIREHDVALLSIVGDVFARPLVETLADDPVGLPSLKAIVSSGAQWSPAVKAELLHLLPGLRLIDSLGASEGPATQSVSTKGQVGEAGRFKAGGRARVIDEDGRDVEPGSGQIGQLATVGPGPVAYLGDPEKSAATFRIIHGVRMTVPGDYATVEEDGTITFLGRGSACINTGGEKVYTEEVEAVLRAHPSVHDCAVVGVPDARWGERVVALVQRAANAIGDLAPELDRACLAALAAYKRPKDYIEVSGLGRSDAGKVDLQALRALAQERLSVG